MVANFTFYLCIQELRYYHSKVEIKHNDSSNGWMFISASAWKISVSAIIGGVGMLLSPCAPKSLYSIKKIQLRMMVATFSSNPSTTIISCYSPTNSSEETGLITFYNKLSSLVRSIPKLNVLIIGGDMNVQIGKDENNKYFLHNLSNRNSSPANRLICLNTKF